MKAKTFFLSFSHYARPESNSGSQSAQAGSAQAAVPDGTPAGANIVRRRERRAGFIGGRPKPRPPPTVLFTAPASPPVVAENPKVQQCPSGTAILNMIFYEVFMGFMCDSRDARDRSCGVFGVLHAVSVPFVASAL